MYIIRMHSCACTSLHEHVCGSIYGDDTSNLVDFNVMYLLCAMYAISLHVYVIIHFCIIIIIMYAM